MIIKSEFARDRAFLNLFRVNQPIRGTLSEIAGFLSMTLQLCNQSGYCLQRNTSQLANVASQPAGTAKKSQGGLHDC